MRSLALALASAVLQPAVSVPVHARATALESTDAAAPAKDQRRKELQTMQPQKGGTSACSRTADVPQVFYVGLPKDGTSSFAAFSSTTLNLTSEHGELEQDLDIIVTALMGIRPEKCVDRPPNAPRPDYDSWVTALNPTGHFGSVLEAAGIDTWADSPVPFFSVSTHLQVPTVAELVSLQTAKYVLWPRNSTEYANSWFQFFCPFRKYPYGITPENQLEDFLIFGLCNACSTTQRSRNFEIVRRTYERHIATVRSYFGSTPSRQARYLEVEFDTDDLAGRKVCEFVFEGLPQYENCASLHGVPNVSVEQVLRLTGVERANACVDDAIVAQRAELSLRQVIGSAAAPAGVLGPLAQHMPEAQSPQSMS